MQHTPSGFPIRLATESRHATERFTPVAHGAQNPGQQGACGLEIRVLGAEGAEGPQAEAPQAD